MTSAKVHEMIANACLGLDADARFAADLRGYLVAHGLDRDDVEAMLAAPPRLAVYRRLVRNNVTTVLHRTMPRTRARLEAARAGAFDRAFDAFLDDVAPRTHYLRDVPLEFLAWAAPRWRADASLPAYAADLAAHELVHFEIGAAPRSRESPELDEVALDRALVFAEPVRLVRYAFAVHELPSDVDDTSAPAARDVALLVYRDAEHAVRFLELTPLAAAIGERWLAGEELGAAIAAACDALGVARTESLLVEIARLLSDLGARGVVLGAAPR
jgi:hypothetical protein